MGERLKARAATTTTPKARGVRLAEVEDFGKFDLRGAPGDRAFMSAVGRALDLLLPAEACQSTMQDDVNALWIGPDQWLVICRKTDAPDILKKLEEALEGIHGSVTDVSAGRAVFRLSGPSVLDVLAKGCPLDLHPRVARPGFVAGSVLAKITVHLHLRRADVVDLYLGRSFADYLWAWLEEAGMDCGLIIDG